MKSVFLPRKHRHGRPTDERGGRVPEAHWKGPKAGCRTAHVLLAGVTSCSLRALRSRLKLRRRHRSQRRKKVSFGELKPRIPGDFYSGCYLRFQMTRLEFRLSGLLNEYDPGID